MIQILRGRPTHGRPVFERAPEFLTEFSNWEISIEPYSNHIYTRAWVNLTRSSMILLWGDVNLGSLKLYYIVCKDPGKYGRVQILPNKVKWKRIYSCDGLCKKTHFYRIFDQWNIIIPPNFSNNQKSNVKVRNFYQSTDRKLGIQFLFLFGVSSKRMVRNF